MTKNNDFLEVLFDNIDSFLNATSKHDFIGNNCMLV